MAEISLLCEENLLDTIFYACDTQRRGRLGTRGQRFLFFGGVFFWPQLSWNVSFAMFRYHRFVKCGIDFDLNKTGQSTFLKREESLFCFLVGFFFLILFFFTIIQYKYLDFSG